MLMPEINPYEAPQSIAKSDAHTSARRKNKVPLSIKTMLGLQTVAGLLVYFFWVLQGLGHSGIAPLQDTAGLFGIIFLLLGVLLMGLSLARGHYVLFMIEVFALAFTLWEVLPEIW
jgi:hypothetical protein